MRRIAPKVLTNLEGVRVKRAAEQLKLQQEKDAQAAKEQAAPSGKRERKVSPKMQESIQQNKKLKALTNSRS